MAEAQETFLIDSTGLFEASQRAFLGIPLLLVDGNDYTYLFGVIRDLLQLMQGIGIGRGVFVVGREAHRITGVSNIEKTISSLHELGIAVVHDSLASVLDLCVGLASIVTCFVTHNRSLLLLASDGRRVILLNDKSEREVYCSDAVISRFGVTPSLLPEFRALTDGPQATVLTRREAISVLQQSGDLAAKVADPSIFLSRQLRSKLTKHGSIILERLKQFSPSGHCSRLDVGQMDLGIDLDNDRSVQFLAKHGFYSLRRLLSRQAKAHFVEERSNLRPRDYQAIITSEGLQRFMTIVGMAKACAVDTEASGKDPHTAELFGVSVSVNKDQAFYIPAVAPDLHGIDRETVLSALRKLLEGPIRITGHNLKYDYVLLRRNGIRIANVYCDTMLAAYDCFGDSDFLNLQYLAKRLLGVTIKSHREVVSSNSSLLDMPFNDVADYACAHADVTRELGDVLQRELVQREIDEQYNSETVSMVKTLGDWEVDGIPVDLSGLCRLRKARAERVSLAKDGALDACGCRFNLDSEKELSAVLRMDSALAKVVGFRRLSCGVLEELAIGNNAARMVVQYNRRRKELRDIEAVIETVHNGRAYPVFSQTRTDHCRLTSIRPMLLDVDDAWGIGSCLPFWLRQFCPNAGRALATLADAADDKVLRSDLVAGNGSYCLPNVPQLIEGNHYQLLLSFVTGVSNGQMRRIFLMDGDAVATIHHSFKVRYSATFEWLEQFCRETQKVGFASTRGRRRYFDGLRSSNLGKRDKAMYSAVEWLIKW
jgi:DNA polymerase I-like protein with 3'-5' exonuclease and polymerase domains